ncbi:MAG: TraB/GumN family protein [Holophaga sp.]|nr:TraB/GumN family protein [Holophaga sp.]
MRRLLLSLAVLATLPAPGRTPEVHLVGVIHNLHFSPRSHYSLADLREQILALEPDLICGEITPEALGGPMEGYFPPEAVFLAEMAPRWRMRFSAVDWRMDSALQEKAERGEPADVAERAGRMDQAFGEGLAAFAGASLYDFVHLPSTLEQVDLKFEKVIGENTVSDLAAGSWHERNRRIVANSLAAAEGARRILIVFGASHLPQLVRQLEARGIKARIAPRRFQPGGSTAVPRPVVERWRRNLENLKGVRDGRIAASADALLKVRRSNRVRDLEQAIQASSIQD